MLLHQRRAGMVDRVVEPGKELCTPDTSNKMACSEVWAASFDRSTPLRLLQKVSSLLDTAARSLSTLSQTVGNVFPTLLR